jgi:hypothetical protein
MGKMRYIFIVVVLIYGGGSIPLAPGFRRYLPARSRYGEGRRAGDPEAHPLLGVPGVASVARFKLH